MTAPITIRDFCDQHDACGQGRDWALARPVAAMRELWRMDILPRWRVWIATRQGVLSDRDLRLFAVWCACCTPLGNGKTTASLLRDQRSRTALIVATRYALGIGTKRELAIAHRAATAAVRAAWAAARAARAAYDATATAATYDATATAATFAAAAAAATAANAHDAAHDAAYAAAYAADAAAAAAYDAAETTAIAAARKAQADHLITLLPEFPL